MREDGAVPGVRRRLRDVTKKVSGVLAGPRDEAPEASGSAPAAPAPPAPARSEAPPDPPSDAQEASRVTTAAPTAAVPPVVPSGGVEADARCVEAVDVARAAALDVAGAAVGDHLGVEVDVESTEAGHAVTHSFAALDPAYAGWRWAVTVARAEGADTVTVDEVVLLPGSGALLAPAWVPWSDRVQPGDLGPGDLLPPPADDPRLVPSYADVDAERLPFDLHRELGLGRPRVLSRDGRADAAERWYDGLAGPDAPLARNAPGRCGGCGFLVPLAGSLGRVFGACANAMAPDDGRVVALTHGCGAHSETVVEQPESTYAGMAVELEEMDVVDRAGVEGPAAADGDADAGAADAPRLADDRDPPPVVVAEQDAPVVVAERDAPVVAAEQDAAPGPGAAAATSDDASPATAGAEER